MTGDPTHVVWWSLLLGGLLGGVCRSIVFGSGVVPPYMLRDGPRRIIELGSLGDIIIGPVAALLLLGASSTTYQFQTGYDATGFWAPFTASIVAGLGAIQVSQFLVNQQLDDLQKSAVARAAAKFPTLKPSTTALSLQSFSTSNLLNALPETGDEEAEPIHETNARQEERTVQHLIAQLESTSNAPQRARILDSLLKHVN